MWNDNKGILVVSIPFYSTLNIQHAVQNKKHNKNVLAKLTVTFLIPLPLTLVFLFISFSFLSLPLLNSLGQQFHSIEITLSNTTFERLQGLHYQYVKSTPR